jgi:hypothetical protein
VSASGRPPAFMVEGRRGLRRAAPGWFVDWVKLGARAASGNLVGRSEDQLVLAVSAPVRSMAAAAVAFGFCWQNYMAETASRSSPPALESTLNDLEKGTKIWLRTQDWILVGTFFELRRGDRVRTSSGTFQLRKVEEVRRVPSWAAAEDGRWPMPQAASNAFLQEMLRHKNLVSFLTSWSSDLVLVGSRAGLASELEQLIGPGESPAELAPLREVIRPFNPRSALGWRSVLMSAHDDDPVWASWQERPKAIVLDGAYAVGRWLEECHAPLVVAVLGRAEPGLDSAVSVLQQQRAYGTPLMPGDLNWTLPVGCELLAFRSPS